MGNINEAKILPLLAAFWGFHSSLELLAPPNHASAAINRDAKLNLNWKKERVK